MPTGGIGDNTSNSTSNNDEATPSLFSQIIQAMSNGLSSFWSSVNNQSTASSTTSSNIAGRDNTAPKRQSSEEDDDNAERSTKRTAVDVDDITFELNKAITSSNKEEIQYYANQLKGKNLPLPASLRNTLRSAIQKNQTDTVALLLDIFQVDLNVGFDFSLTRIIAMNQPQLAQLLIQHGANPHARDRYNQTTPLHEAAFNGHTELVRMLISEFGADPHARNEDNRTPLHEAACNGHTELARMLISEFGADPHARNEDNRTPLHLAASYGHTELARMLISEFHAELNAEDIFNRTPFEVAAYFGRDTTVEYFLSLEAVTNAYTESHLGDILADNNNFTLINAASAGNLSLVNTLLRYQAVRENITADGNAALRAAHNNHHQAVFNVVKFASSGQPLDLILKVHHMGIEWGNNEKFYEILNAPEICNIYISLLNANIPFNESMDLYDAIIEHKKEQRAFPEVAKVLHAFHKVGITYPEQSKHFDRHVLIDNTSIVSFVLNALFEAGYYYQLHSIVYEPLLISLRAKSFNYKVILNTVDDLCRYSEKKPLILDKNEGNFDGQQNDLGKIVLNRTLDDFLTLGPLPKSSATAHIERILEQIASDINLTEIIFREPDTYILKISSHKEINLSLLIKNANLSQIVLSKELTQRLGEIIKDLVGKLWGQRTVNEKHAQYLDEFQVKALSIYFTNYFSDINAFFRSEPLSAKEKLNDDPKKNRLAAFLIGGLVNDALNKLSHCPAIENEHDAPILDRREILKPEHIHRRLANPWRLPALTSCSIYKEGLFPKDTPATTSKILGATFIEIYTREREVILAHGEQVITTQGPDHLVSTIVRSPSLDRNNHYFSDRALERAFNLYLRHAYKEQVSFIIIENTPIQRPIHGLPHVYRGVLCVELVVDYFSHYALDSEFKRFCQTRDEEDIEWLRAAATFIATGRQSEISPKEDYGRYQAYRRASRLHFEEFIDEVVSPNPENMRKKEKFADVLEFVGNPKYEGTIDEPGINKHPDMLERKERNFIRRILIVAHKIDLVRCYNKEEYTESLQCIDEWSKNCQEQQIALNEIIQYNIQLIKAHGDTLHCEMQPDGKIADVKLEHKDIFVEASLSLKRVFEISELVRRPFITLPFQFRNDEEDVIQEINRSRLG